MCWRHKQVIGFFEFGTPVLVDWSFVLLRKNGLRRSLTPQTSIRP